MCLEQCVLALENKLEKFHSLSELQYESYLFLGHLTFILMF